MQNKTNIAAPPVTVELLLQALILEMREQAKAINAQVGAIHALASAVSELAEGNQSLIDALSPPEEDENPEDQYLG